MNLRAHPYIAGGLALSLLVTLALFLTGLFGVLSGEATTAMHYALWGGFAGFLLTFMGALPACFLKTLNDKTEDSLLGFAAGMMLAASSFSLLLPGLKAGLTITGNGLLGTLIVVCGICIGVMLVLGIDAFMLHRETDDDCNTTDNYRLKGIWLFVLTIALHNLPEGMAIGVSFAQGDLQVGIPLTSAIAVQDIPEGLAVAMALRGVGYGVLKSIGVAALTGLLEPFGAVIGLTLSSGLAIAYPIGLGAAAGAMIYVVANEIIPETHRNGNKRYASIGLVFGFVVMMTLDTAFG